MIMRWSEFKQYVDEQIADHGGEDDPVIEYIDISRPDLDHLMTTPDVAIDDESIAIF